jgi:hypothetical protein
VRYFCQFQTTAQSKQSPNGQKLDQSGHPDLHWLRMQAFQKKHFDVIYIALKTQYSAIAPPWRTALLYGWSKMDSSLAETRVFLLDSNSRVPLELDLSDFEPDLPHILKTSR